MKKSVKITLICGIIIILIFALSIGVFFLIIEPDIILFRTQTLDLNKLTSQSRSVTILDVNGRPISDAVVGGNNKIVVDIDELHDYTINAFIAIEDKRFYKHSGVDYKRMISALFSNIKTASFREGASTITQQLIKNTHLSNEKTIERKINEIRLARKLERIYDKRSILQSYFNILYFGSGIRGLGTASSVMFDRPASQLTLAQSAALASIINNPSKYSPYYNEDNLTARKNLVLKQMLDQKYISREDYESAIKEQLHFGKSEQTQFVTAVLKEACSVYRCSEKELFIGNTTIKTVYDPKASSVVRDIIKNSANADATVRVLILDNDSGGIVCDETNSDKFVNPRRSPASTIKPFLSYASAIEHGMNPLSQVADEPTSFGDYTPGNYKDVYRGYISLKDGLSYSSNIVAVKLMQQCGVPYCKSIAQRFGLPFAETDCSLSLALGGMKNGVTLVELANAYRTLANGGMYSAAHYVRLSGNGADHAFDEGRRAVGDDTAYLITDMLRECAKTGTAKRLKYSGILAAKTGTNGSSDGNTDCYCIAFTPSRTVAVWIGAKKKLLPNSITGASCCDIIKKICDRGIIKTDEEFTMPRSVSYFDIDGKALENTHEVYLADPMLPGRYRRRVVLSKRHLPVKRDLDLIDYYDNYNWEEFFDIQNTPDDESDDETAESQSSDTASVPSIALSINSL